MLHHLVTLNLRRVKSTSRHPTFTDKSIIPALLLVTLIPFAPAYSAEAKIQSGCGCEIDHIHSGMDWNAPIGQPIPVAREGDIVEIGKTPKDPCGNFIVIKHHYPNGKIIYSRYAQLGVINLEVGQHVQNAAIIGQVGKLGTLHFEVRPAPSGGENTP